VAVHLSTVGIPGDRRSLYGCPPHGLRRTALAIADPGQEPVFFRPASSSRANCALQRPATLDRAPRCGGADRAHPWESDVVPAPTALCAPGGAALYGAGAGPST